MRRWTTVGAVIEFLIRGIGIGILLLVGLAAAKGIWWLARPSTAIQITSFDILIGSEVQKDYGQNIARMLGGKIKRVDEVLANDLTGFAPTPGVRIDSVISPALRLKPDVPSRLDVELRPFNFDVAGILSFASGLLHHGPVLKGNVVVNEKQVEIFAEYDERGRSLSAGPWSVVSAGSVDDAVDQLAYLVVRDLHRSDNPQLGLMGGQDFKSFSSALVEYEAYIRGGGPQAHGPLDEHLHRAIALLEPLADKKLPAGLVFSYLGSIYVIQGEPKKAELALQQALNLDPQDQFARNTLGEVKGAIAAQPVLSQRRGALDDLLKQPALDVIHLRQALAEAGATAPVAVGVLADGVTAPLEELKNRILPGRSFVSDEPDTDDRLGHGTNVSTLIAAIAPTAQIVPIKVIDKNGVATSFTILSGLDYAAKQSIRILVVPLGGMAPSEADQMAIQALRSRNILPVGSAGNQGSNQPMYPAATSGVLAVATTDNRDRRAAFSSFGPWVSLAAPGVEITTIGREGKLQQMSGGSFSCAIVAGVAAVLLSVRPELSAQDVEAILKQTAVPVEGELGAGRIDALRAVQVAKTFQKPSSRTGRR